MQGYSRPEGAGEPGMNFGKCGLAGSSWKQKPIVSSTLGFPRRLQPNPADGVGKSDSQLACLGGQGDRALGPVPATQPHPPSLAGGSRGPHVGLGPGDPHPWAPQSRFPLPTSGEAHRVCISSLGISPMLAWGSAQPQCGVFSCLLGRTPGVRAWELSPILQMTPNQLVCLK